MGFLPARKPLEVSRDASWVASGASARYCRALFSTWLAVDASARSEVAVTVAGQIAEQGFLGRLQAQLRELHDARGHRLDVPGVADAVEQEVHMAQPEEHVRSHAALVDVVLQVGVGLLVGDQGRGMGVDVFGLLHPCPRSRPGVASFLVTESGHEVARDHRKA